MAARLSVDGSQDMVREKIKQIFRTWDVDNSGTISRAELADVMQKLGGWNAPTVATLMDEIDVNKDGAVSYEEFVDWLINPASKTTLNKTATAVSNFDLSAVLKPLFRVYDRDGSGLVKFAEFQECHSVLQGALKMHPQDKGHGDPLIGRKNIKALFDDLDADHDGEITLDEFATWQGKIIELAGIPNYELTELVNTLAETLAEIYHIDEQAGDSDDPKVAQHLKGLIERVASTERHLWCKRAEEATLEQTQYTNHWTEPPVGLSLDRLIRFHMGDVPVRTKKLKKCTAEARLCLPERPQDVEASRGRIWYAKVLRTSQFQSGPGLKTLTDCFHYAFHDLAWRRLAPEEVQLYDRARDSMAPELQMFCLLKAEANMGVKLDWRGVQAALADGVEMELLTAAGVKRYNQEMLSFAMGMAKQQDSSMSPKQAAVAAQKTLNTKVVLAPRHVMAGLSDYGIMKPSPVWAEFMEDA